MTAFAEQVVALLDHLGARPQAVVGGTSLGANVALEVAALAPERVARAARRDAGPRQRPRGRDPRLRAADVRGPLPAVHRQRRCAALTRPIPRGLVPFWAGIALDTLDQRADAVAAVVHGIVLRPGRAVVARSVARISRAGPGRRPPARPDPPGRRRRDARRRAARTRRFVRRQQHPRVAVPARAADDRGASSSRVECWQPPGAAVGPPEPSADAGRMEGCLSTATRRSCCAPTSWARPTASSPC